METPFQPQADLENMSPEVRSYIYQTILEFEPFTTPNTTVAVVAKDPRKLAHQEAYENTDASALRRLWRIGITLSEEGTQIEEEGVHEDIYVAIRLAKEKLIKTLSDIQDNVLSNQDRIMQINNALAGHQLH
jgi:ribosome-associated translation inhibitor RaiA